MTAGGTNTVQVKDVPVNDPNFIVWRKQDIDGKKYDKLKDYPQGAAELSGAEYTVKFYASETVTDTPTKTWVFRTDENGRSFFDDPDYLISGDSLYANSNGDIIFPLGTVTVQETKAPEGYLIDNTVYTGYIYQPSMGADAEFRWSDGTDSAKVSYNSGTNIHWEDSVYKGKVQVTKYSNDSKTTEPDGDGTLEGTEFTIYNLNDNPVVTLDGKGVAEYGEAVGVIKTNANGYATTKDRALPYGSYKIKETKAPTVTDKEAYDKKVLVSGEEGHYEDVLIRDAWTIISDKRYF